jgi:hypothetical protein
MNRNSIPTAISWLSLILSLVFIALLVGGVVANAAGNADLGNGLPFLGLFVLVAWFPVAVLAIAVSPKSTVARVGCLLPFFVWAAIMLLVTYVFKQL